MEGLDLTLKLGLPISDQIDVSNKGSNITGQSSDEFFNGQSNVAATNKVDVNLVVSNYIMQRFSGAGKRFSGGSSSSGEQNQRRYPPAPVIGNQFVVIDVPARRAQRERELANAGRNANAVNLKRCTNFNCNTADTPMWRKGPLGPKTLCNACGIKYRKEEDRKRARGEATGNTEIGGSQNNPIYINFVD